MSRAKSNKSASRQTKTRAHRACAKDTSFVSPSAGDTRSLRKGQARVEKILVKHVGPLEENHPRRWSRHAYWLLAGVIYQQLALDKEEVDVSEIVALGKVLAENRRAESQLSSKRGKTKVQRKRPTKSLRSVVRELYGLDLPEPDSSKKDSNNKDSHTTQ